MKLLKFLIITVFGLGIFASVMTVYISGQHSAPVFLTPIPTPTNLNANKLFQLVNDWRVQNGYRPFIKSDSLCKIATVRLSEIEKDFSHDGFSAKRFFPNAPTGMSGENLAEKYQTEKTTLNAWLNSPEHLANLKYPYKYSCIETSGTYAVQEFATF